MKRAAVIFYMLGLCLALPTRARADVTVKDSTGATVTYDTSTSGSVHTGHTVPTDGAGTRQGTSAAPFRTDPTGTTAQPVTDNSSTLSVDDGGGSLTVDGTVAVTGVATQTTLAATLTELQSILSKLNAALGSLGQAAMAASAPVVIASNQSAIPVTDNSTTLSVDDGASSLTVDGTVAVTGVATESTLGGVLTTSAFQTRVPVNGQGAMAASIPVAIASNQTVIPVSDNSSTLSVDDGAGSLTVDGTVTINAIPAGSNNIGDVDVLTIAAGDNNIGNVDLASAIPAGTANIGDVDILTIAAGNNNIGDVDIASIAAGSNAIGKLAANSGVDIGDVDVTSVTAPSTVYAGQTNVATATTEVTLGSSQTLTQGCWIKAFAANGGNICVGLTGVSCSTGYILDATETVFVPIANRTTIFIDTDNSGDDVSYICF